MVSVQKVAVWAKKSGVKKGGWNASGRVKGWGTSMEGYEVEGIKAGDYYVCRYCFGRSGTGYEGGGHKSGEQHDRRCSSYTWRTYSGGQTGRVEVSWREGEHPSRDGAAEMKKMAAVFEAAGMTVEFESETRIVVS